jgi:hypothetical protein
VIELVATAPGNRLDVLFWNGHQKTIAHQLEHHGRLYLAHDLVVAPVQTGGGFGGGGWIPLRPRTGRVVPFEIPAITGTVRTAQARQESVAFGEMIDTELEMVTLLLLELA